MRAEVEPVDFPLGACYARELEGWLRTMPAPPRTTFVTHGKPDAAVAMRQLIGRNLQWNVRVPE